MNKTSFSNTLYSFPKIMSKENSTFYKTFYSNSSPKTSKVSLKLKSSSPSSQPPFFQNQNIPLSSYAKYTSH